MGKALQCAIERANWRHDDCGLARDYFAENLSQLVLLSLPADAARVRERARAHNRLGKQHQDHPQRRLPAMVESFNNGRMAPKKVEVVVI